MPPIVKDYEFGKEDKRNRRGFLPSEMVHKKGKLQMNLETEIPDYLMVVSKKRANFLVKQLEEMNLGVK